ncbi:catalase [Saccharopolyspora lacisalsi]|uniref:Catalase n=1 Tax=Halosaccharopolyspora lacisalsi TaxID=1000566 RepID=A0A839DUI7_9PSEU|nr:catalase [Halosaccharopolyspora lacisalsi]MBA8824419.1 catalase [Halosaccharopolyspora lacisalsi]
MASQSRRDAKDEQLDQVRKDPQDTNLTTQQGVKIDHTDDALTAGERGPTLLEDFHTREKITHFDHERIPERVVHARGSGAYGQFQPYSGWLSDYTAARFLTDPQEQTPVFVRFSTVQGSKGSNDTVRDVRGFATKFYTSQGNYDLVGNNMPAFFIQDGIKFPDFVHAVKPEPDTGIPQGASAHDTLWDFVQLQPETMHMMMWLMSDRAIPRSYRMMQGFGVHTFRLVNAEGRGTFVKFHWKPMLGTHSLVWDETQKIAGKNSDYNRQDLWENIANGDYPEWELGVQLVDESREHDFDFDLLDATKIIPEEEVPVQPVGKLTLNRNPDNFFAETEQVAFHTANVVPGIDFTNDPLLQARNFSYLDTQLIRLGGPNFSYLPVNRAISDISTHQRDGFQQNRVHTSKATYHKNSLSGGCPAMADDQDVFRHYQEKVEGAKISKRSESFKDHYSQATLFWNSMAHWEKDHIISAFRFELGKVEHTHIREGVVEHLNHVDHDLAVAVAEGVGVTPPSTAARSNHGKSSPALSQENSVKDTIATRQVAVLVADGVDSGEVEQIKQELTDRGAVPQVLSLRDGSVRASSSGHVQVDARIDTLASVVFDAVVVPGTGESVQNLSADGYSVHFVTEAYKHFKPVAASQEGVAMLQRAGVNGVRHADDSQSVANDHGVITAVSNEGSLPSEFFEEFASTLAGHRVWDRDTSHVPA